MIGNSVEFENYSRLNSFFRSGIEWEDGVMLSRRVFVGKKRVYLLRCLDVPIMMKSVLLSKSIVFHPARDISETFACLMKISMSAVETTMYDSVSRSQGVLEDDKFSLETFSM